MASSASKRLVCVRARETRKNCISKISDWNVFRLHRRITQRKRRRGKKRSKQSLDSEHNFWYNSIWYETARPCIETMRAHTKRPRERMAPNGEQVNFSTFLNASDINIYGIRVRTDRWLLLLHGAPPTCLFSPASTVAVFSIAFDIDVDVNCGTVLISYDVLNVISFSRYLSELALFASALFRPAQQQQNTILNGEEFLDVSNSQSIWN